MACRDPLKGYRSKDRNPSGKRSIVFTARDAYHDQKVDLPCGQCIFCRLERSRQWATRCLLESKMHEDNCFITLTYSDENLPPRGTLQLRDFQLFMKRLRKKFSQLPIRFFHCGEYGEQFSRPHYHACLFGFDFLDKQPWKSVNEQQYYRSPVLEELWPLGSSMIGALTFESAAYVARYITKKFLGKGAERFYEDVDEETGEVYSRSPEYVTMSRRPGIGKTWLEKYEKDVYPSDMVVVRGKPTRPPKFYDSQFEITNPQEFAKIKAERQVTGRNNAHNCTHEKMLIREEIVESRIKQLVRNYENGS